MLRGRAVMSLVADRRERRAAFATRKAGLMNKAQELAELYDYDVPVVVVCRGADGEGEAECWTSKEGARAVAERFYKLPKQDQTRHTEDHADYVAGLREAQSSKLVEVREGGIAAALGPWERALDDMSEEALLDLLFSIESPRMATGSRIRELQLQHDESVAENSVTGEDGSDGVQGPQPPAGDAVAIDDDDDAEWMNQKPEPANGNAVAPYNAGIEYVNVGGYVMERDAYDFIRYDLGVPPPSLEPESPDYGEPLQLWSWDDSSFPQSAPPPAPSKRVLVDERVM